MSFAARATTAVRETYLSRVVAPVRAARGYYWVARSQWLGAYRAEQLDRRWLHLVAQLEQAFDHGRLSAGLLESDAMPATHAH